MPHRFILAFLLAPVLTAPARAAAPEDPARDKEVQQLLRDIRQKFERIEQIQKSQVPSSAPESNLPKAKVADPKVEELIKSQDHPRLGRSAPVFELSDYLGRRWRLEDQLAKGPIVLMFYEGYNCPNCVRQLRALDDDLARFHALGAEVIAISSDPPQTTKERFEKYRAFSFPVLSDPENRIAQLFGLAISYKDGKLTDRQHGAFVIGRNGTITWTYYGEEPFKSNRTLLYELERFQAGTSARNAR